ncbi:hypothetical protein E2C01_082771 [Portunus trituberculatus]|uniref:Uncharacterized protein n=1 Tax=Portunus trituberculatus TaxID=210409 RepID=A0A5B7IQT4_PORTR|nr:hypothetical protein [Portunus trituberculatus]
MGNNEKRGVMEESRICSGQLIYPGRGVGGLSSLVPPLPAHALRRRLSSCHVPVSQRAPCEECHGQAVGEVMQGSRHKRQVDGS